MEYAKRSQQGHAEMVFSVGDKEGGAEYRA